MTGTDFQAGTLRNGWRCPVVWGVVAFAAAVLVALTAPASSNPPGRIAISLCAGGTAVLLLVARGREWSVVPLAVASVVGGALLVNDAERFIVPVTRGGGVVVLLLGLAVSQRAFRVMGWAAGVIVIVMASAAAALFVVYDRLLLPLTLGIVGSFGVAIMVVGIIRASDSGELDSRLTIGDTIALGTAVIGERASNAGAGEAIHDKVLYEGDERRHRFFRFLMLMGFASALASLGVIADSTAVVIGAMLVAPLLTPLMGMSLALVSGWVAELRNAGIVAGAGVVVAIGTGFFVAAVVGQGVDVDTNTQIISRTSPTLLDLFIAVAAGAAGAYAVSRSDVSDALPGVAVAIALVPPLAVVGVTAQLGESQDAVGALLLFATNAVAILLMGALTFVVTGTAAATATRAWRLDWWIIAFAGLSVVVLGALVANTSTTNEGGARTAMATRVIEDWIGDGDYELVSVTVDDGTVSIVMSGAEAPDDSSTLAASLTDLLGDDISLDLRVSITERVVIEPDDES